MTFHMPDDREPLFRAVELSSQETYRQREHSNDMAETDEQGDYIFRFRLDLRDPEDRLTLPEFYREQVRDLLKIVRFYYRGAPVVVDAFAFLNDPENLLRILPPEQPV
jgi:hypothetical protein